MKQMAIKVPEFEGIPAGKLKEIIEQLVKNNQDIIQGAAEARGWVKQ